MLNIRGKELTPEQEKKIDVLYDQWIEEAKQITEPPLSSKNRGRVLDGRPSGLYHEMTMKYRKLIKAVIDSDVIGGESDV